MTVLRAPTSRSGRERSAGHDGGGLLVVVLDAGRDPADPRDPGRPRTSRRTSGSGPSFVPGVVTAVRNNGFWMQDPMPDANPATSEGIFVFTSSAPTVIVGEAVTVSGLVSEFRPGGASTRQPDDDRARARHRLPGRPGGSHRAHRGRHGRPRPAEHGDRQRRVRQRRDERRLRPGPGRHRLLREPRGHARCGSTTPSSSGRRATSARSGWWATTARAPDRDTNRGGIVIAPDDFNPERIQLDDVLAAVPDVNVGDRIPAPPSAS